MMNLVINDLDLLNQPIPIFIFKFLQPILLPISIFCHIDLSLTKNRLLNYTIFKSTFKLAKITIIHPVHNNYV